jgi:hypothetical protein
MGRHGHVRVTTIERLDHGHLHPLLKHSRQIGLGRGLNLRPPAPQAATLAKSYRDSFFLLIGKLYIGLLLLPVRNLYTSF